MILIEPNLDIPSNHFTCFVACNSKPTRSFYRLKDKILKVFGKENDYDLQHIVKKCHTCNGTGYYCQNTRCRRCSNGVYEAYDVVLQRYLLNDSCFHIPIGRLDGNKLKIWDGYLDCDDEWGDYYISKWRYKPFSGIFKNTINGIIKHTQPTTINPEWAYWYLLHQYDHPEWMKETSVFLNPTWNKKEFQLRNYLWLTSEHGLIALSKYYKCEDLAQVFFKS